MKRSCWIFFFILFHLAPAYGGERITILFTSDLHSHLTGTGSESKPVGGVARLAQAIEEERKKRPNPCLIVDGGDFLMGTLFHTISREEAIELTLMKKMGYEAVAIGNHEFDLRPEGLASVLIRAKEKNALPVPLLANIRFDGHDPGDDALAALYRAEVVRPFVVLQKGGLRIGLFALMGVDAAEAAPFARPVRFTDPVATAHWLVKYLREVKRVDMVIGLFHGGLAEAESLARKVDRIDLIIAAHGHVRLITPIVAGGVPVVEAGSYGAYLGILDLEQVGSRFRLVGYRLRRIDESIEPMSAVEREIDAAKESVDRLFLESFGLSYGQVIAATPFDLIHRKGESNLGNLIADALLWYVNYHVYDPSDPASKVVFYIQSNGVIRDGLKKGLITIADAFRSLPLGIGKDGTIGYPIASCYLTASEIKKVLEIATSIAPMKGDDYFLAVSGLKFTYNPYRLPCDRVVGIWLDNRPLDYSSRNRRLYRVAANLYNAAFLQVVGSYSYHLLDIVPKDRFGKPLKEIIPIRLADGRELKEWLGFVAYLRSLSDTDGDGIPDVPERYRHVEGRAKAHPSLNPKVLICGSGLTSLAVFATVGILTMVIVYLAIKIGRIGYGRKDRERN